MKRDCNEYRKPYGRGDYALHRGQQGIYWQAGHGLVVRMAANEQDHDTPPRAARPEMRSSEAWPGPARS